MRGIERTVKGRAYQQALPRVGHRGRGLGLGKVANQLHDHPDHFGVHRELRALHDRVHRNVHPLEPLLEFQPGSMKLRRPHHQIGVQPSKHGSPKLNDGLEEHARLVVSLHVHVWHVVLEVLHKPELLDQVHQLELQLLQH